MGFSIEKNINGLSTPIILICVSKENCFISSNENSHYRNYSSESGAVHYS